MTRSRFIAFSAAAAFVATVYLANWLISRYGTIRVWPTTLIAPCGVYAVGVAFLLRDTVQRFSGQALALVAIAAGTGLSVLVSPKLALASGVAFAGSELAGLAVFRLAGGNTGGPRRLTVAVVAASVLAAALDSYLFLSLAFHDLTYWPGQFTAKLMVVALAFPFVVVARRKVVPVAA